MPDLKICPHCGAANKLATTCWLCGTEPEVITAELVAPEVNPYATPAPPEVAGDTSAYGIVVIALLILLVVVMAALTSADPGLAIIIAIVALPALVRTAIDISRRKSSGQSVSAAETSLIFLASVAGVVAAGAAAGATFLVACTAICFGALALDGGSLNGNDGSLILFSAIALSILAGLLVLALLWKRRS